MPLLSSHIAHLSGIFARKCCMMRVFLRNLELTSFTSAACPLPRTVVVMASQRNSKAENESMALELQQVRSKLIKAKKEAYRLEKNLVKTNVRTVGQALDNMTAPPTPSSGTLVGDCFGEERPRMEGGERRRSLSRKWSHGRSGSQVESKISAPTSGRAAHTTVGTGFTPGKQACFHKMLSERSTTELPAGKEVWYPVGLHWPMCEAEFHRWRNPVQ